ncbi:sigma-E factor negative regulatory protein [Marinibactrum halimedae]|uniref:Anti sigma-E protein RseA N-terminal domain-containing protein n=1 Tax=Marinibactrum halimedae TaxID=1444977 RepID=A0AA37T482_9GAMM|nr:sigma-E factor negative regulatory protein [Marinibactrum halimedae]MCD9458553.1 sigma-E factor negative regulatory protein [Marinibactrum halimedae]GLS26579.1 hypothetical protein GCM10007877_22950 [Marinibactrum halimedae]
MAQPNGKETMAESLSALMDGETSEFELRRVLSSLDDTPDLKRSWSRYHLARGAMKRELPLDITVDLSAAIADSIADEPAHTVVLDSTVDSSTANSTPATSEKSVKWLGGLGKMAVAASVAMVTVLVAQQVVNDAQQTPSVDKDIVADATPVTPTVNEPVTAPVSLPIGYGTDSIAARTVSAGAGNNAVRRTSSSPLVFVPRTEAKVSHPGLEEYLNQIMVEHAQTGIAAPGSLPFNRVPRVEAKP